MRDLYESTYGIFNHLKTDSKRKPLASVAFHRAEDFTTDSLLEEITRTYIANDIGTLFKISLLEFLDLPHDHVQMLIAISQEKSSEKAKVMNAVESEFK